MPTDLPVILLWGVPGAVLWLLGQVLIVRAFRDGRRKSPGGIRLTIAGTGLIFLGWVVGVEIATLDRGEWAVALVLLGVMGWLPVVFFWLATRPRVTVDE